MDEYLHSIHIAISPDKDRYIYKCFSFILYIVNKKIYNKKVYLVFVF